MKRRTKQIISDFIGACIFAIVLALFCILALTQQPSGYYAENPDKTSDVHYIWIEE